MYSNSKKAVVVRDLSKEYLIAGRRRNVWEKSVYRPFLALDRISLKIAPGELVGIIGRNGAGKSTLLKILTRITPPTTGEAELYGRVGSLLEVGTGFHPELTGRENIFLNGSILGMRRAEIKSQFDAIVAFAGVERFLEMPVKRYSSGMYVRLAFAVAAHLKSEILLVDEVLSVGDVEFQRHCLGKIKEVANSGRTVLFVSHHLESVTALCKRAILLQEGKIIFDGKVDDAVESYLKSFSKEQADLTDATGRAGTGEIRVAKVKPSKAFYNASENKRFQLSLKNEVGFKDRFFISIHIVNSNGVVVFQCDSRVVGKWFETADFLDVEFSFKTPWLKPGMYSLDVFVCSSGIIDSCDRACVFEITPVLPYSFAASSDSTANGVVFGDFVYES